MARRPEIPENSAETAKALRDSAKTIAEYRRAILLILYAHDRNNYTAEQLGDILGVSRPTVFSDLKIIKDSIELKSHIDLPGSGGRHNSYMTKEEEIKFLSKWEEQTKDSHILNVVRLHKDYNKVVGKIVSKSTIYRLLERNNWKKVKSDNKHSDNNQVAPEDFKKKSPYIWVKVM
jgi:DNA-binding CsgD family transcriptional regulator